MRIGTKVITKYGRGQIVGKDLPESGVLAMHRSDHRADPQDRQNMSHGFLIQRSACSGTK